MLIVIIDYFFSPSQSQFHKSWVLLHGFLLTLLVAILLGSWTSGDNKKAVPHEDEKSALPCSSPDGT